MTSVFFSPKREFEAASLTWGPRPAARPLGEPEDTDNTRKGGDEKEAEWERGRDGTSPHFLETVLSKSI